MISYSSYVVSIPGYNCNFKIYDQERAFKLAASMATSSNIPVSISKNQYQDNVVLSTKLATINPKVTK